MPKRVHITEQVKAISTALINANTATVPAQVVIVQESTLTKHRDVDLDGFQRDLKPIRVRNSRIAPTRTHNHFHLQIQSEGNANTREQIVDGLQRGGDPPYPNG